MRLKRLGIVVGCLGAALQGQSWADLKWDVGGGLVASYNDNLTYSKDNRISDQVSKLILTGGFLQEGKNEQISLQAALTQNIYAQHSEFNNFTQDLAVKGNFDLSAYDNLTFKEQFLHGEEPFTFEDAFGRAQGRYSFYHNRVDLGYTRLLSEQWKAGLRYLQNNDYYSRSDLKDSASYNPSLQVSYDIDSANQVRTLYEYSRRGFVGGGSGISNTISGGWKHYFSRQWFADLRAGLSFIDSFSGKKYSKPVYEASLTDEADENTRYTIKFLKDSGSNSYSQDIFSSWRWSLSGFKYLGPRWQGLAEIFYGQGEYNNSGIKDKLTGVNLNLEYELTKKSSVFLAYVLDHTESNVDTRGFTRNYIGLGFKLAL